ncbi:MAG TPA: RND transporter, partial [Verrucomicrobiota bacterium]|nr:RND transporter [Verrucomicrobiota bacterium]
MKVVKWVVIIVLICSVGYAGINIFKSDKKDGSESLFKIAEVKRGDIVSTISASGVVEPEEVVDVGAQVAGRIVAFGKDKNGNLVDYGSEI